MNRVGAKRDLQSHNQLPIAGIAAVVCFGWTAAARAQHSQSHKPRPNVLLLAVDDMKDWVGCLGGYEGVVHTPHIDRLASQGVLFTNAHCASPKCAPSRAALLTGLQPSSTGLYDNGHWWLPNMPDVVTLPRHFKNNGYYVAGAGKIFHHTAGNHPARPWHEFQRITFQSDPWFRGSQLNYPWSTSAPFPKGFPFSKVPGLGHENDWGSLPIADGAYDDAQSADYVIRSLKQTHGRPFFLACGLFRPHLPWYVPKRFFDMYPIQDVVPPKVLEDDLDDLPGPGKKLASDRRNDLKLIRHADRCKQAIQAYLASISYADDQIGRVLAALEASEHADNTIVVLWSDHGWHLGEKKHWHKSTLWEESTRVPLVIKATEGSAGGVCSHPVSLIHLYPTLIELCDLPSIDRLDGVSLAPLLIDPQSDWDRPAIIEFRRGNAAVRDRRYRLIQYHDGSREFYDHQNDPLEWHNRASDPKYSGVIKQLAQWLPKSWADDALTKRAFEFDPHRMTWKNKATGNMVSGN